MSIGGKSSKNHGKKRQNQIKFVVGPNFRSKSGCNACKQRRRKCDESEPSCLYCHARNIECVYKNKQVKALEASPDFKNVEEDPKIAEYSDENLILLNIENLDIQQTENSDYALIPFKGKQTDSFMTNDYDKVTQNWLEMLNLRSKSPSVEFYLPLDPKERYDFGDLHIDMSPLRTTPSSLPSLYLDNKGIHYLEYFQNRVSNVLAICNDNNKNYFRKLFFLLASNEETFTYIVTAWGGLYLKNREVDDEIKFYLDKGLSKFNQLFSGRTNEFDYYFQLCFFLIMSEMNICIGETKVWRNYFEETHLLIEEYGGLEKLCEDFGYSHEIRFIISNLQYNDIMSSKSLRCGTRLSTELYERVFSHPSFVKYELNYGIDTLQGCHQSVLLLLGDIMNHKAKIEQNLQNVRDYNESSPSSFNSVEYSELKKMHFKMVHEIGNELNTKIEQVTPNMNLLNSIQDNPREQEIYYKTYLLYKLICKFYLLLYIKQITPNNYQVQSLLIEAFELIDYLISTKMNVILCLPLLVCAICCYAREDKDFIKSRVEQVKTLSPVKNLDKCWAIIEKVWELNPLGNVIVDWSNICEEFGWELNIC